MKKVSRRALRAAPAAVLRGSAAVLALFSTFGFNSQALAASSTWNGGSTTDGNWSDTANWAGGVVPGATAGTTSTDIATFNAAIANGWGAAATPIVIDQAGQNIGGINFATAAGNYFIGSTAGNPLLLTTSGTIQILSTLTTASAVETINAPLVIEGAAYAFADFATAGGTLSFGGPISGGVTGASTLTLAGTNVTASTISGAISNGSATSLGITQSGGTWTLSGSNTFTGGLTVNSGTMSVTNAIGTVAAPAGAITVGAATAGGTFGQLNLNSPIAISASSFSVLDTNGVANINNAAETINLNGGALNVNNGSSSDTGLLSFAAGTMTAGSVVIARDGNNHGAVLQTAATTTNGLYIHGGNLIVTGAFGDGNTTNANSSANFSLTSGSVSVAGVTTVSSDANGRYALFAITSGTFNANGGFQIGGTNDTAGPLDAELLITGGVLNTLGLNFAGNTGSTGGTQELMMTGGTIYSGTEGIISTVGGTIALSGGTIAATAPWTGNRTMALTNTVTFKTADPSGAAQNITLGSNATLTGAGNVTKTGAGILTMAGANTYTGNTAINAGILNLGIAQTTTTGPLGGGTGSVPAGTISFGGGTLQYSSVNNADYSSKIGNSTAGPISIDTNGVNVTFASALAVSNTDGLTLSDSAGGGSLTITATDLYTGTTTINPNANLVLGDGAAHDGAVSGSSIADSGTLTFDPFDTNGSNTVAITGTGTVRMIGSGREKLGGASTFSGQTIITSGTLDLVNTLALENSNVVNPNAGLTFDSSVGANAFTLGGITGSGTLVVQNTAGGAITLSVGNNNTASQTYAGSLSGVGTFQKVGTGTLDLTGASSANGAISVSAGVLEIGFGGSVQSGTPVNVGSAGTLILGDGNGPVSQTLTLSGSSTATVVNGSTTASTLTLAGVASYPFAFGGAGANQNNLNIAISGTSGFTGTSTYTGATTVNAGGTLNLNGGTLANTPVTVSSGGTLTGAGNNSTTGVIGGTVTVAGGGAISLLTPTSAALLVSGTITLGDPSAAYGTANSYATLNFNVGTSTAEALNTPGVLMLNTGGAFINITDPTQQGTFTLANFGSLAGPGSFSLSSGTAGVLTQSVGRDTETLSFNQADTALLVTITGVANPGVAYFDGAISTVWNDTSNAQRVNWSLDKAGTTDAGNVPGTATDVVMTSSTSTLAGATLTTTLGGSTTINSLNFNSVAASNTIAADNSTLTINGTADSNTSQGATYTGNAAGTGIRVVAGSGATTINVPIILGGTNSQSWINNSSSLLTVNGAVTGAATAGTQTLTLSGTGSGGATLAGIIGDNGLGGHIALVVNNTGGGVTTLSGSNSFTGGVTLDFGAVIMGTATALGPGSPAVSFGAGSTSLLELNGNNLGIADLVSNGGAPIIENGASATGTSTLTVTTANTDTFAGLLQNGGAGALALSKGGSGSLTLTGANSYTGPTTVTLGALSLTGTLAGSSITTSSLFSESNTGVIAGAGVSFTNAAGSSTLLGINSYTGATTITSGTLQLGDGTVADDGTIIPSSGITDNGALIYNRGGNLSSSVPITGGGSVTVTGSGSQTLAGANSYTGPTTVTGAGTLILGGVLGGSSVTNNGTFTENAGAGIGGAGSSFANVAGVSTLNGTNTYTGATTITTGTMNLGGSLAGSNITNNATFNESSTGGISGAGSTFTNTAGVSTLNGANSYTGATTITTGTLNLGGTLAGSNVTNNAIFNESSTGGISGAGSTFTNTVGTTTLSGSNSYTGATTITAGTLILNGSIAGSAINNNSTFTENGSGGIGGAGSFTNTTGVATLAGVNTYTGVTNVTAGTVTLTGTLGSIGTPAGAITIGSGVQNANPIALNVNGGTVYATSLTQDNGSNATGDGGSTTMLQLNGNGVITLTGVFAVNPNGENNTGSVLTSGTMTAGSVTIGRFKDDFTTAPLAGIAGDGLYVNGATLIDKGNFTMNAASSASMVEVSGSVGVAGTTFIACNNAGRWSVMDIDGGTFTSTDLTANGGIVIGGVNATSEGELLLRAGVLNTHTLTLGATAQTAGAVEFQAFGGTAYIGTGGIVSAGTGPTLTINLGSNANATAPIIAASGNWTSTLPMTLTNSSGGTPVTFQTADANNNPFTIGLGGTLSGGGGLAETGASTLTLSGTDTFTGSISIGAGATLAIGGGGSLGSGSYAQAISDAGTFNDSSSAPQTLTGTISGAGGVTETGPGTLTLAGAETYTGVTTVAGGTLSLTGTLAGSNVSNAAGFTETSTGAIGGAGVTFTNTAGTATLSGSNTYTGATTVSGGTLELAAVSAYPSGGGAITVSSGATLAAAVGGAGQYTNGTSGAGTLGGLITTVGAGFQSGSFLGVDTTSGSVSYAGAITTAGLGLAKLGANTLTLTGANTYTGATNISVGTLAIGSGGSLGNTAITVASGATFQLAPGIGAPTIGSPSLTLAGGSTLLLGGAIPATGETTAFNTLNLNGTLTIGGASAANLTFDINNTSNDLLAVSGAITFGAGGGVINIITPFVGTAFNGSTQTYTLITGASGLGTGSLTLGSSSQLITLGGNQYAASLSASTATSEILTLTGTVVLPVNYYWRGNTSASWSAPGNFATDHTGTTPQNSPLGSANNVVLTTDSPNGTNTASQTLDNSYTINSLSFGANAPAVSLGTGSAGNGAANTLTLTGSNSFSVITSAGGASYGPGVGMAMQNGAAAQTLNVPIALGASQAWEIDSVSNPLTVAGVISDGSTLNALTKTGAGTLILTNAETYDGGTIVSAGTLALGAGGQLLTTGTLTAQGTGTFDLAGNSQTVGGLTDGGVATGIITSSTGSGMLTVNNNNNNTFSGTITDSGNAINGVSLSLTFNGPGNITLSGSNSYNGPTTLTSGTLNATNNYSLGNSTSLIGGLQFDNTGTAAVTFTSASPNIASLLTYNGLTPGTSLVILGNASGGGSPTTLYIGGNLGAAGQTTLFNGTISDLSGTKAAAIGSLNVTGGALVLESPDTFTGTTVISGSGAELEISSATALQDSTLNYNNQGGTFSFGPLSVATLGGLTGAQPLALTNGPGTGAIILTIGNNNVPSTYTGNLSGMGSLIKVGTGTVQIGSGANGGASYAGPTTVNQATLIIGGTGTATGAIAVTGDLGVCALTVQDSAVVNTSGTVILEGGGGNTYAYSATMTVSGSASVTSGGFAFGNGASRVSTGVSLTIQNSASLIDNGTFDFIYSVNGTSTQAGTTVNLNGGLLGVQKFILTNAGGNAASAASIQLNGGTLEALAGDPNGSFFLPVTAKLTADVDAGGAIINTNGFNDTIAQTLVHGGGTPDGGVTKNGAGTLTLLGANSYTGITTLNAGTLKIDGEFALGGSVYGGLTFNGGTLQYALAFSGSNNGTGDITANSVNVAKTVTVAAGGATIDTNGNAVAYADPFGGGGAGSVTLTDSLGTGSLTLEAAASYAGATTINSGATLQLGTGVAGQDGTILTTSGITDNGSLIYNRSGALSTGVAISGTGSVTMTGTGTQTLAGIESYTGATAVNQGRLIVSGSLTGTSFVSVSGTAHLEVDGLVDNSTTVHVNSGAFLNGTGTVGPVNIASNGILGPGRTLNGTTAGTLTANGNVVLTDSTSQFSVRLGVVTPGDNDKLAVTPGDSVSLNGATLKLTLGSNFNSYALASNYIFVLINGGTSPANDISGQFAQGSTITDSNGDIYSILYNVNATNTGGGSDVDLELTTAVPEPGTWSGMLGGFGILMAWQRARRRRS